MDKGRGSLQFAILFGIIIYVLTCGKLLRFNIYPQTVDKLWIDINTPVFKLINIIVDNANN